MSVLVLDVATTPVRLRVNKNEDFVLTIPVLDATGAAVDLTGWSAVATVTGPGAAAPVLYSWSTTAGNLVCDHGGAHLTFSSAVTAAWVFDAGEFELDVVSPQGLRRVVAAGPFTAVPRQGTPA